MILGTCGIAGGVIIFLLPETKGRVLCETVEDVEERSRRNQEKTQEKNNKSDDPRSNVLTVDVGINTDEMSTQTNKLSHDGKHTDGEIVRSIVLSNPLKFGPNNLLRSSISRSGTGSINCLLETEASLSTKSFGTKNISPFEQPQSSGDSSVSGTLSDSEESLAQEIRASLGIINESYEKENSANVKIQRARNEEKNTR